MQQLATIKDRQVITGGILFTLLVCLGILALGTLLIGFELAEPDPTMGGFFYEWQLANPTFWSRATAWLGFGLHQLLIWLTIWWAIERSDRKYGGTLKPVNWIALGINAVFIVLHLVQTAVFYDGIAQDLPSWTAQFTVIMMLFVILALENRRRGLFFGKKIHFRQEFYRWIRDYHGYAFSFAIIYTFWFHPMVPTWGHVVGFAYTILVMLQGSLMFTRAHLNKRWIVALEVMVLPHAALIAINQTNALFWMFFYGFVSMFIVTQMHALNLKPWVKNAIYLGFALSVIVVYGVVREPYMANEIIRIPVVLYGMVFLMYGGWWLVARLAGMIDNLRTPPPPQMRTSAGD